MSEREKILAVKDLNIVFNTYSGPLHAIRGVSFDLYKGETLAIVGESGSGKSVTTRAVMGILPKNGRITHGSILLGNEDLAQYRDKDFNKIRGKEMAMIFQDPMSSLDPVMKIGKQISEALVLNRGLSKGDAKEKALQMIEAVGIDEPEKRYNQYPFHFSGGMRQRIVIAIALACNPSVLICDEPTTALDVTIQAQILDLIKKMQEEFHLSVIFITHDLGVVAGVADRVSVMYAGKIVEYGTVDEIFDTPAHPYTWALLSSMPDLESDSKERLVSIPGTPPNLFIRQKGDYFAPRNRYAMKIDLEKEPPLFKISDTHFAATWLQHEYAPTVTFTKKGGVANG